MDPLDRKQSTPGVWMLGLEVCNGAEAGGSALVTAHRLQTPASRTLAAKMLFSQPEISEQTFIKKFRDMETWEF